MGGGIRGGYLPDLGEPLGKCGRHWAWKVWVGVWAPVLALRSGTRGSRERHTNDTVIRTDKY